MKLFDFRLVSHKHWKSQREREKIKVHKYMFNHSMTPVERDCYPGSSDRDV